MRYRSTTLHHHEIVKDREGRVEKNEQLMQAAVDPYKIRNREKILRIKKEGKMLFTLPTSIRAIAAEFVVRYKPFHDQIHGAVPCHEAEK